MRGRAAVTRREYRTRLQSSAVLALWLAASAVGGQREPAPRAVVAGPIYDFGSVEPGQPLHHVFRLRNLGGGPLRVHRVESTCACTVAGFDSEIQPGKEGAIQVDLDTKNREGAFAVHLQAFTNDPDTPEITLTLKAAVAVGVVSRPGYVRFVATAGFDEPPTVALVVLAHDAQSFSIRSVESPYVFIEASFREAEAGERLAESEGSQWVVAVRLMPSAPEGPLVGFLEIRTDHPRQGLLVGRLVEGHRLSSYSTKSHRRYGESYILLQRMIL